MQQICQKIFINHKSDKGLASKIYEEHFCPEEEERGAPTPKQVKAVSRHVDTRMPISLVTGMMLAYHSS